jgi:tyrosyl-tRNA synthetase
MSRDKLISRVTNEELIKKWTVPGSIIAYAGIDPTAAGIHIGHLLWLHLAIDLLKNGQKFIVLVGGFTGKIGDPTDKNAMRTRIDDNMVNDNSSGILSDIQAILKPYESNVTYVNNKTWLDTMTIGEYLNYYGYAVSVNRKLNMDTFAKRINNHNMLSMSEFFYPDLQMIDFYYLNKTYGCNVQLGGGDQFGNIAFGTHYVEKLANTEVYGAVTHLLTDSNSAKFGKSTGAKYLRNFKDTYHFCMNLSDNMVNSICEFFDIEINEEPQETKRSLVKYIISLFDQDNYERKFKEIQDYMNRLFYSSVDQALSEDFITLTSKSILELVMELSFVQSDFEAAQKLRENAIKINGATVNDNITISPGQYKISMGKKHHAFIHIQ